MNPRILGLIALCGALAVGIWLANRRNQPRERGADVPVSEASGISPRTDATEVSRAAQPGEVPTGTNADAKLRAETPPRAVATPSDAAIAPAPGVEPLLSQPPTAAAPMISPPTPPGSTPPDVPSEQAAIDLDKVNMSLRDFRTIMGENPIGTNLEITRALNGGNPKQARLIQDGLVIDRNGELVDRWGTPYFFHQLSKDHMEIRSAGPDRLMGTNDDSVSN